MCSAIAILMMMTVMMMKISAQGIEEMCKNDPVVPCRKDLKDGPWYQLGDNRCMRAFFYTQHLNFENAEIACNKYNAAGFKGQLVSINNKKELDKVMCAMYKVHPGKPHYWIGLKRLDQMFPFQPPQRIWTDGHVYDFRNWAGGQPNNYLQRESCTEMNYWSWGLWNDEACWSERPYMCQVRLY
ncbi:Galactose-specific lectin nattectin [Channa argus]|uniref:Galactose-specific lectin nattectin n=1 Tax=Channa argus TaxID=215402 RepID=A0A6G1QTL0_CHAAH|nr:Galactose-specific lectin nattectin [Channa argus]KAK2882347.1 hypothetical protein Q8A73_022857 [Channa argus]